MNSPEILIIEDEAQIRKLLQITLESNQYKVRLSENGKEGILMAANHPPDLIILDIGLPDQSGHEVLKQLREWFHRPILMLSALDDETHIVKALDNGANDYLSKPFRTGELLARIRSALRSHPQESVEAKIQSLDVEIDLAARTVKKQGEYVKLTVTEYALLAELASHEGRVLTHQYLLKQVWGPGYAEQSQYLRVFIAQIRKKIEEDPNKPQIIITEAGIGYRFMLL